MSLLGRPIKPRYVLELFSDRTIHVAVIRKFGTQRKGKGASQHLTGIKEHTGHVITLGCLSVVASRKNRPICSEAVELKYYFLTQYYVWTQNIL